MIEKEAKELKQLVRIANTDLQGEKPLYYALAQIKGINFMFANMICSLTNIDKNTKTGYLTDEQIKKIDEFLKDPRKYNAPAWMFNRRRDWETGEDKHLLTGELDFVKENDIKKMKMIRSYRGIRHILGLPVRGQRTKSNFRKNKGKVLGVKRRAGARLGKT